MKDLVALPSDRLIARLIDLSICSLIIAISGGIIAGARFLEFIDTPTGRWISSICGTLIIETTIYSILKFTPGKRMVGLMVCAPDQTPLSAKEYFKRNMKVLLIGAGTWFPIISFGTIWRQFDEVKKNGSTTYDRGRFLVIPEKVTMIRRVIAWSIFVGIVVLTVLAQ
jgi:uncharacterized RDD family membrane protein YckC